VALFSQLDNTAVFVCVITLGCGVSLWHDGMAKNRAAKERHGKVEHRIEETSKAGKSAEEENERASGSMVSENRKAWHQAKASAKRHQ